MNKCYIVSIELIASRSNSHFIEAIKSFGNWAILTQTTFAVVSTQNAEEIRNYLAQYLYTDERLFVIRNGGAAAWKNIIADGDWLKKNIPLN